MNPTRTRRIDERKAVDAGPKIFTQFELVAGPDLGQDDATFTTEHEARRAFVRHRLRTGSSDACAVLVARNAAGQLRVLCWFGPVEDLWAKHSGTNSGVLQSIRRERPGRKQRVLPLTPDRSAPHLAPFAHMRSTSSRADARRVGSPSRERLRSRRRWRGPLAAITLAVAAGTVGLQVTERKPGSSLMAHASSARLRDAQISVGLPVGYEAIRVESQTLDPGGARSWAPGEGMHQVTVTGGTLSVESEERRSHDYLPGQSYIAGWAPYSVRNATHEPVTATITYLLPSK